MKNHYQVLELPPNASPRRIKEQYRKLAKLYHPDRLTDPTQKAQFQEKFKELNEAYQALSEIVRRARLAPQERKLDYLYQRGQKLYRQHQWAKAMMIFSEILAHDSTYRDTSIWLKEARRQNKALAERYATADTCFQQQRWAEAEAGFESILREDPTYRDAAKKFRRARREQVMADFVS